MTPTPNAVPAVFSNTSVVVDDPSRPTYCSASTRIDTVAPISTNVIARRCTRSARKMPSGTNSATFHSWRSTLGDASTLDSPSRANGIKMTARPPCRRVPIGANVNTQMIASDATSPTTATSRSDRIRCGSRLRSIQMAPMIAPDTAAMVSAAPSCGPKYSVTDPTRLSARSSP